MNAPAASSTRLRRAAGGLFAIVLAADLAVAFVACSSSTATDTDPPDATTESGTKDGGPDAITMQPDTSTPTGGHCPPDGSTVTGPCDVVLQDCPVDAKGATQECVVENLAAKCVPVQASQQLGVGRACCANNATGNPCRPGLSCVGAACTDGGPMSGRCSPACCDDKACGKSDPEGISGACDVTLVDDQQSPLFSVCSYRQRCQPFGVEPCTNGQGCEIDDDQGTATCSETFGKVRGQSCGFKNDCADGFICVGSGAAAICRWMCLLPNTVSPFDAGLSNGTAGKGGCPTGEKCSISFSAPSWLGACAYTTDGG